jgi:hypothetical protein
VQAQTLTQKEQKSHVLRHSESANLSPSTSFDHDDGSNSSVDGISQVITKPMPRSKALLRKVKKRPTLLEAAIHVRRLNAFSHLFKKVLAKENTRSHCYCSSVLLVVQQVC